MNQERPLEALILTIRDQKVILDADLAVLYGVPTKALNQAVKRNAERFPNDFLFRLTPQEWQTTKLQIATSITEETGGESDLRNRSQTVTSSQRHRDPRLLPFAFTEHGALMAANVLNSPQAVKMSLFLIRAFVKMREQIAANAAILKRLAEIDRTLLTHDTALLDLYRKIAPLLAPPPPPPRRRIGFR